MQKKNTSTEETASETDEVSDDKATEETTTEVVEEASVEAEVIEEGEVDGAETYAIGDNTNSNAVVGKFTIVGGAEPTITITEPNPDSSDYVWSEADKTFTVAATATVIDTLTFSVTDLGEFVVKDVTAAIDSDSSVITVTDNQDSTYTIDANTQTIAEAFTVTITTLATHEVTVDETDVLPGSIVDGTIKVNGENAPQAVEEGAEATLTFTLAEGYRAEVNGQAVTPDQNTRECTAKITSVDADNKTFAIKTVAQSTVTVNEVNGTTVTYSTDGTDPATDYADPITVDNGTTFKFAVTTEAFVDSIVVKVNGTLIEATNDVYSAEIAGNTVIDIEAETKTFPVTIKASNLATNFTYKVNNEDATEPLEVPYDGALEVSFDVPYTHKVQVNGADHKEDVTADGVTTYTYEVKNVQADVTIEITADQIVYTITETVNPSDSAEIEYKTGTVTEDKKINKGTDLEFTVTPAEGKIVDNVTVDGDVIEPISGPDDKDVVTYKVAAEDIAGTNDAIAIAVTTADKPEVTDFTVSASYNMDDEAAKVVYTDGVYAGKVIKDSSVVFKVNTKDTNYVVTYKVGDAEAQILTAVIGTYTIEAAAITGNVFINVTKQYDIAFTIADEAGDIEVKSTAAGTPAITNGAKETVNRGESFSFTVDKGSNDVLEPVMVTGSGEPVEVVSANDIYTVTPTEDVAVDVTARNYAEVKVTFAHDNDYKTAGATEVTKIINLKVGETTTAAPGNVYTAKENDVITFQVSPNFAKEEENVYKIVSVKVGTDDKAKDLAYDETTKTYTLDLTGVTEGQTVTVDSMLDATKASALTFAVTGGTKVSYTATMESLSYNDVIVAPKDEVKTDFAVGDTALTKNTALTAVVTAAPGYTIDAKNIKLGDKTLSANDLEVVADTEVKAQLILENGKPETLNVTTVPTALGIDKKLNVVNNGRHMTVSVMTDEFVTSAQTPVMPFGLSDYGYNVSKDATEITFTVKAEPPYEPTVDVYDVAYAKEAKENVYTYTVSAKALFDAAEKMGADVAVIRIDEDVFENTATVLYNEAQVKVTAATTDGTPVTTADAAGGKTFTINGGSELLVTATPLAGYAIDKAETKLTGDDKAEAKQETVKPEGFTFSIKAEAPDKATTTTITAKAVYVAAPLMNKGVEVEAVNGVYAVDYAQSYTAGALLGTAPVTLLKDAAEVLAGRAAAASKVEVNGTTATIAVDASDAGKTLTVNLYTEAEKPEDAPTKEKVLAATYTLKVAPALTSVKVDGVKGDKLTQTIDTVKTYKVTVTPNTANPNLMVEAEDADKALSKVTLVDGVLSIKTAPGKESKTAIVKIYDDSKPLEDGTKNYVKGGTFTVTTAVPAYADKAKPTVKFVTATDTTVTVSLALPKGVEAPAEGELYYNVTVTPQAGEAPKGVIAVPLTEKVPVTVDAAGALAASQSYKAVVNTLTEGQGAAWKFDVTATLEQNDKAGAASVFKSAEAALNGVATRNPWYEGKLGLKKAATTIYTGQENVLTATAVFGKNTSYTRISAVEDITKGLDDAQRLVTKDEVFYADPANYTMDVVVDTKPYVNSDDRGTELGKHTLKVTAEAEDGMYAATATLTVNVVRGIEEIGFANYEYNIYKAAGKAASLKLTPVFNKRAVSLLGTKNGAPKTKKVTWDIVEVDAGNNPTNSSLLDKDHPLYKQITVSNGTVKVDKKYNGEDQTFAVIARAADYKQSDVDSCVLVTITSKPQELGRIALVKAVTKYDVNSNGYVIDYYEMLDAGQTFSVRDLQNTRVVVFDKNADVIAKDFYTSDELGRMEVQTPMTYKSSNAGALSVDANTGWMNALKPGKNITLTATTTDGSKNTVQLKGINIAYEKLELGLDIQRGDTYGVVNTAVLADYAFDTQTISYTGTKESYFEVFVREKSENGVRGGLIKNTMVNYTLSVSGGKVLEKAKMGECCFIQPTAQTTKVTLTNKVTGERKEYRLENTVNLKTLAAAPKATTKDKLLAGNNGAQLVAYTFNTAKYDTAGKVLMVSADVKASEFTPKTNDMYYRLINMANGGINGLSYIRDNSFVLNFDAGYIPAGSYKLYFTFGHIGENGEFVAETKPATVNLKAAAPQKDSFKPVTSYKLAAADNYTALLTGKESGAVDVTWGDVTYPLLNANVNGQPNAFNELFTLQKVDVMVDSQPVAANYYIKLRDNLTADQMAKLDDKANLTGYIKCYAFGHNSGVLLNDYVKVTVSLVPTTAKYAVTNATVLYADKTTATVEFAEKLQKAIRPVDIAYVEADAESGFTAAVVPDNNGVITLSADKPELKKHTVKLVVVPTDNYYAQTIVKEQDAAKKAELLNKFGIKVTANVTVTDKSDKMISFTSKELQKAFTNAFYTPGAKGTYNVTSVFTENVQSAITNVAVTAPKTDATEEAKKEYILFNSLFTFDYDNAANVIVGHLDKATFEKAVADKAVTLGAAISVPVTVSFGTMTQNETFKYTLPKEKAQTFKEAQIVIQNYEWDTVKVDGTDAVYEKAVVDVLNNLVASGKLSITSDMDLTLWNNKDTGANENGIALAEVDDTTVKATITLKNLATAAETTQEVYLTKNAPTDIPQYVKAAITEFTTDTTQYVEPFATAADAAYVNVAQTVRGAIKAIVEKGGNKMPTDLTIMIANANVQKGYRVENPKAGKAGSVSSYIIVRDMKNAELYGGDGNGYGYDDTTFSIAITALQTPAEAVTAAEKAIKAKAYAGELNTGVTEESIMAAVTGVITNAAIKAEWGKTADAEPKNDFAYQAPTAEATGSLSAVIKLTDSAGDAAEATLTINDLVLPKTGDKTVADAVAAAVTGEALARLIKDSAATLETAISNAATAALGTDAAAYAAAVTGYEYNAATATAEGSIKFTCTVTHKAGTDASANPAYTVAVITVDEKLAADASLQTLTDAQAAAQKALDAVTLESKDFLPGAVSATETTILEAVKKAVVNTTIMVALVKDDKGVALNVTKAPTVKDAGTAAITLKLSQTVNDATSEKTITRDFAPEALPQTLAEAKTAAEGAVKELTWYKDMTTEAMATAAVKTAVEAVVKTSDYSVAVDAIEFTAPKMDGETAVNGSYKAVVSLSYTSGRPSNIVFVNVEKTITNAEKPADTPTTP